MTRALCFSERMNAFMHSCIGAVILYAEDKLHLLNAQ